ncbi:hypothetical protein [Methanosphaera sp.]
MNEEQKKRLVKAVEQTEAWERIPTNIEGVFIVKTPEQNNNQTVFVEINPSVRGQPIKRRGLYLKSKDELTSFLEILNNPKVNELLEVINKYYSKHNIPRIEI